MDSTEVRFAAGELRGTGRVLAVHPLGDGRCGVVTDRTPFHPVDHTWPDQPGDTGWLAGQAVTDAVTAASKDGELLVGVDVPAKRGAPEWAWHVLHVLDGEPPPAGAEVELVVDGDRRAALSAGHTGCHLVAFALNAALADRWRKPVGADSLGDPDFDSLAMVRSRIVPDGSVDEYRIGKSLRKKGFTPGDLAVDAATIAEAIEERLATWLGAGAKVGVRADGPLLTDMRTWVCELPDGTASVPCGGTHLGDLSELRSLTVELQVSEDETALTLTSTCRRR